MAIVITPESELGKEMAKWNVKRPFAPFPRMLYRARRRPDGVVSVGESSDAVFGGNPGSAESWTNGCQLTVNDDVELSRAAEQGWRATPAEALAHFESRERGKAEVAALRNFEDRNMSDAAKAEIAAAEAASPEHVAEVPESRRRRRTA